MATFIMFGKYSIDAVGKIGAERSKKAVALIRDLGGETKAAYALLGETDVVAIVELPGVREAMRASVELSRMFGVSFTTSPAVTVEEFDKLIEGG